MLGDSGKINGEFLLRGPYFGSSVLLLWKRASSYASSTSTSHSDQIDANCPYDYVHCPSCRSVSSLRKLFKDLEDLISEGECENKSLNL